MSALGMLLVIFLLAGLLMEIVTVAIVSFFYGYEP